MPENPQPVPLEYEGPPDEIMRRALALRRLGLARRDISLTMFVLAGVFISIPLTAECAKRWISSAFANHLTAAMVLAVAALCLLTLAGVVRLTLAMGKGVAGAVVYGLMVLLLPVGILLVAGLVREATRELEREGVQVNLLGPRRRDLP